MSEQITAERRHAGEQAVGVLNVAPRATADPMYQRLAGALAWTALGRRQLDRGAADVAIECARAGLAEIEGAPPNLEMADDTALKLSAAEDRLEQGHAADAAEIMLDALEARVVLHAAATGAEPAPSSRGEQDGGLDPGSTATG